MRYFRRLPPVLRVANILGLLFPLVTIVIFMEVLIAGLSSGHHWGEDASRVEAIAINLGLIGAACSVAVNTYSTRFRQTDRRPFPLDSWQSQVRAILLAAALPICAIALAIIIPLTSLAWVVAPLVTTIGGIVLLVASVWMNARRQAQAVE